MKGLTHLLKFLKKLELFPKGSKDKQIEQGTQKYLAKCDGDCRGNILKNIMIFSKKLEKRKVFILNEKDAGLAIKSMSIDSEVSFLRRKRFNKTLQVHAQKFGI